MQKLKSCGANCILLRNLHICRLSKTDADANDRASTFKCQRSVSADANADADADADADAMASTFRCQRSVSASLNVRRSVLLSQQGDYKTF